MPTNDRAVRWVFNRIKKADFRRSLLKQKSVNVSSPHPYKTFTDFGFLGSAKLILLEKGMDAVAGRDRLFWIGLLIKPGQISKCRSNMRPRKISGNSFQASPHRQMASNSAPTLVIETASVTLS
jgi:hypothetical protein